MLETKHAAPTTKPSLAFVPRQVSLATRAIMKKNEKAKSSETLEPVGGLIMKSTKKEVKKKKSKKSGDDLSPLLLSIAVFLKQHGFSKTLAALQSEASIEEVDDGHKVRKMDLETYYKHLETSQYGGKADLSNDEELEIQKIDISSKVKDKKKKKSKSIDAENVGQDGTEVLPLEETNMRSKDAKRKKNKTASKTLDEDIDGGNPEGMEVTIKRISESSESSKPATENGHSNNYLDHNHVKSKDKKQKNRQTSESSGGGEDMEKHSSEKENNATLEETAVGIERKSSKKRKKAATEDDELQPSGKIKSKEAKQGKMEGSREDEGNEKSNSVLEIENPAGKRRKTENGGYSIKSQEASLVKRFDGLNNNVEVTPKELIKENTVNKGLQNGGTVESAAQRSTKKQRNGSAEPKTVNAFQRVKVDEVEFADNRLQDNSYWAKEGAESGYGARAQEVLGQVRGRDFRHEKTKKKRGSYRGGQIDLQTYSIKFQYSDED